MRSSARTADHWCVGLILIGNSESAVPDWIPVPCRLWAVKLQEWVGGRKGVLRAACLSYVPTHAKVWFYDHLAIPVPNNEGVDIIVLASNFFAQVVKSSTSGA